ncbi:hypothetical protein EG329_014095 [Mollisiaceae sp. DMI_Dod_QoI]|nr:hypothetical protein EG329_014095 [Helotiales sp. DMI_Dod_QoI]
MEAPSAQPILQRYRPLGSRKYGRYDFERFDHLSSSHASIGHGTFDKVNVDCRFLFKKSRWGVLGEHKNPAGIIYLDLTFNQPKGSQLHSATISITLDDEDKALREFSGDYYRTGPRCPVQMTDCYGPKGFAGPERTVQTKKSLHLTPRAEFLGYGVGGMGVDRESTFTSSSRWKFSGTLLPGKGSNWAYKTLKWDLSENDLEAQSTHSNQVHTAFTFEHSGQPFLMRVEIKGKLKKFHGRVKDKLMKFPSHANKEDDSVATLIKFGDAISFTTPLDERARQLQFEMELANMNAIPMEVSDPKPATFLGIPQNADPSSMANITAPLGPWSQQPSSISNNPLQQPLPSSTQPHLLQGARGLGGTEDASDPMIANLAQAFVDLQSANRHTFHQDDGVKISSNLFPTGETETTKSEARTDRGDGEISRVEEQQQKLYEEQMLLRLLSMPALLTFLRLIAGLLGYFGQTPASTPANEEEDERQRIRLVKKAINGSTALPGSKSFSVEEETIYSTL